MILVGDAAGLVEPITGEGIAYALESGLVAAKAITQTLSLGSPAMAGRLYSSLLRPAVLKHLKHALHVRWLLFSKPCLPVAMHVMSRHPRVVESYLELLSGKLSYPAYFRRMFASLVGFG